MPQVLSFESGNGHFKPHFSWSSVIHWTDHLHLLCIISSNDLLRADVLQDDSASACCYEYFKGYLTESIWFISTWRRSGNKNKINQPLSILTSSLSTRARRGAPGLLRSFTWSWTLCFWGPAQGVINVHDKMRKEISQFFIQDIGLLLYLVSPWEGWGQQRVGIEQPPQAPPPSPSFPPPSCCCGGCSGTPSTNP